MTYFPPDGRVARTVDQLLDLLLLATLLAAPLVFYTKGYDVFEFNKITVMRVLTSLAAVSPAVQAAVRPAPAHHPQPPGPAGAGLAGGLRGLHLQDRELAPFRARRLRGL